MFPFFGPRHGKLAVLDLIRQIAARVQVRRFERETIILGVDTAASMPRYYMTERHSEKSISLRVAQFAQFKAGRLINMHVLADTLDLVEQALGRQTHVSKATRTE